MSTKHFLGGRIILGTEFSGYKYRIFEAGTSTPKTTYKDSGLTAGNENTDPIVLDANGACQIWFDGNAKAVFYTSADVVVYTDDNVNLEDSQDTSGEFNAILNPSFEIDSDSDGIPDNWTRTLYTNGAFTLDTTTQGHGETSAKFTSTGSGGGYLTSTNNFSVSPLSSRLLSFSLKGTADVRNVVEVLWYKADGTASSTTSTTVYDDSTTNPTSWTRKKYAVSVPSDAYLAKLRLTGCHSSDSTSGSTWFDDVEFKVEVKTTVGDIEYMGASGTGPTRLAIGAAGTVPSVNNTATGFSYWAPRGHIGGLTLSNNGSDATNDIDIAVGEATDSTNAVVMKLTSAITKQLDAAWAVGTNQGGLDTGSIANDVYHVWLIMRSDTGVVDVLFSASATSPTMPTNYTYKRRIGAIIRSGAAILAFSQNGDEFILSTIIEDQDKDISTTAELLAVTVPDGIKVDWIGRVMQASADTTGTIVTSPDESDQNPSTTFNTTPAFDLTGASANAQNLRRRTNTSAQIRVRATGANTSIAIYTRGWIDTRERFS